MAVEDAYELAYREAVPALEHQRADVAELRNRASVLLAAGSIAVSLTGPRSLHGAQPLAWATLLCFALLSACVLAVVWPYREWSVGVDPRALLKALVAAGEPALADLCVPLIVHLTRHREANSRRLSQIARCFRAGASLLAIQLVLTVATANGIL